VVGLMVYSLGRLAMTMGLSLIDKSPRGGAFPRDTFVGSVRRLSWRHTTCMLVANTTAIHFEDFRQPDARDVPGNDKQGPDDRQNSSAAPSPVHPCRRTGRMRSPLTPHQAALLVVP